VNKKISGQTDSESQRLKDNSNLRGETSFALPLEEYIDVSKLNFPNHPPEAELTWNGEKSVWEAAADGDLRAIQSFLEREVWMSMFEMTKIVLL
jgi:hypothetical protein